MVEFDGEALIAAAKGGDESAFAMLVERYHRSLVRVARMFVKDDATAEEVAQDTWLAVLEGIDRFEGRSSFRTWLFTILTNRAKTRAVRDGRNVPFSAIASTEAMSGEDSFDADRFLDSEQPWAYHWAAKPTAWTEDQVLADETIELVKEAIGTLPKVQREVISLRDVDGWSPEEVCDVLQISEGNQRVLLHRARAKVRNAIEGYLDGSTETQS
ncbi:MAG: RNA polymerase sigma factor [Solirubrobacterales bacterium]